MLGRRKAKRQREAHKKLAVKLDEATSEREAAERQLEQEKESVIGQLNYIERRNDIGGLINEIFGTGQRGHA